MTGERAGRGIAYNGRQAGRGECQFISDGAKTLRGVRVERCVKYISIQINCSFYSTTFSRGSVPQLST